MSHIRILLAENDVLVAMDLAAELETAGMTIAGITRSVGQALEMIEEKEPDFALLNVKLRDGASFAAARRLMTLRIPFAFLTGYEKENIDPEFQDVPCLPKPQDTKDIVRFVVNLLDARVDGTQPPDVRRAGGTATTSR